MTRVHPRVCGEAQPFNRRSSRDSGPSPRVRGSRCRPYFSSLMRRVHPRVCGEARGGTDEPLDGEGPSPRVRGSQVGSEGGPLPLGSIPACAGKPSRAATSTSAAWVHPRVCGEAVIIFDPNGNRRGSIPACAGKPFETAWTTLRNPGPSPRVRGSRVGLARAAATRRSIPACAGKPAGDGEEGRRAGVHPRVCGEAR